MLDAQDARQRTKAALGPEAELIKPYLDHVAARIKAAADEGKRELNHPFYGFHAGAPLSHPSDDIQKAVRLTVESKGYTWTSHPDPDPDDPRSSSYETITW